MYRLEILSIKLIKDRPKIIITDHGFWQGNIDKYLDLIRYNAIICDKLIYISDFSRQMYLKYNIKGEFIKISNPFEYKNLNLNYIKDFKNKHNLDSNKKIVFFSGISESLSRKGLDIVLKSIENDLWLKENVVCIVISNNEGIEYCNKFREKINLLTFNSFPYTDVINLYNIADVFVLPSKSESFGLVYIESLSYGTPILGFDKIINEFKNNYGEIYIGEAYNQDEGVSNLSNKIKKILREEIKKQEIVDRTYELYSWDKLFEKFRYIYEN